MHFALKNNSIISKIRVRILDRLQDFSPAGASNMNTYFNIRSGWVTEMDVSEFDFSYELVRFVAFLRTAIYKPFLERGFNTLLVTTLLELLLFLLATLFNTFLDTNLHCTTPLQSYILLAGCWMQRNQILILQIPHLRMRKKMRKSVIQ